MVFFVVFGDQHKIIAEPLVKSVSNTTSTNTELIVGVYHYDGVPPYIPVKDAIEIWYHGGANHGVTLYINGNAVMSGNTDSVGNWGPTVWAGPMTSHHYGGYSLDVAEYVDEYTTIHTYCNTYHP